MLGGGEVEHVYDELSLVVDVPEPPDGATALLEVEVTGSVRLARASE